jgi:cupin fold WbuC family metalloprotein
MTFELINDAVLVSLSEVTVVGPSEFERVKRMARENPRGRARICAHATPEDPLHEMLLAILGGYYIRPHAHLGKSESFHIIEGGLTIALFEDNGRIRQLVDLSADGDHARYYRLAAPRFHTVIPWGDIVVFHETTNGPFDRKDTLFADWAPDETENEAGQAFLKDLLVRISAHRNAAQ